MQRYTIHLFLRSALHVSGGSSAHHQELKNCIYSIGYFVKPLLLPIMAEEPPETCRTFHRNKWCYIASRWLYL